MSWPGPERPTLTVEVEPLEYRTMGGPVADPDWTYTDAAGHPHRYVGGEERWPTLRWVVDAEPWCEACREPHEEGHWECRVCGENIEPEMKHKPGEHRQVPGRRTYLIDGEPVTEEEFKKAAAAQGLDLKGTHG